MGGLPSGGGGLAGSPSSWKQRVHNMSFTSFVHAHLQAVVLLAYAALAWVGVGYLWFPDLSDTKQEPSRLLSHWLLWLSVRSILAGVLISLASRQSVWIAAYTTLMSVLFSFVRRWLLPRQYAESEATGILIYFGGFVWLARATSTHPRFWGVFGFDPGHVAAVLLIISIVIYVEVGGTNIVRGLLEKGRVLPEFAPAAKANPPVTSEMLTSERPSEMGDQLSAIKDAEERQDLDREEYNHGRLIAMQNDCFSLHS